MREKLLAAIAILAALPSADAIRDYLVGRGIKAEEGMDGDPARHCPIAVYLKKEVGVANAWAGFSRCGISYESTTELDPAADMPPVINQFIRAFDQNEYPELQA